MARPVLVGDSMPFPCVPGPSVDGEGAGNDVLAGPALERLDYRLGVLDLEGYVVYDLVECLATQLFDEIVMLGAVALYVGHVIPEIGPGVASGVDRYVIAPLQQPADDNLFCASPPLLRQPIMLDPKGSKP